MTETCCSCKAVALVASPFDRIKPGELYVIIEMKGRGVVCDY